MKLSMLSKHMIVCYFFFRHVVYIRWSVNLKNFQDFTVRDICLVLISYIINYHFNFKIPIC